jgi:D-alanyl-D-alanine carboxypeptidase/D-alanyl-D-alanine-endopeptidase (penicillin-binding protein 4)
MRISLLRCLVSACAAFVLLGGAQPGEARAQEPEAGLPQPVAAALQRAGIAPAEAGVLVLELESGRTVVAANADRALNPASVMKVVTTFAALEILGADHRWSTPIHVAGEVRRGVLEGNLHIKGSGDPALTFERLRELVARLRRAGLKEIRGDIVLDRSHFRLPQAEIERFLGEVENPFNIPPDALLLNLKAVRLNLVPDLRTRTVRVVAEPHPPQLELNAGVAWSEWSCDTWRRDVSLHVVSTEDSARVKVGGGFPGRCGPQSLTVSLLGHAPFFYGTFRSLWEQGDGAHRGRLREGPLPRGARLFETWVSPPLTDIVREINKHSNNLMARQVFLELGAPAIAEVATLDRSRDAMRRWLADKGIDPAAMVFENGSGLSFSERATARTLARLLELAAASEAAGPLLRSLSVVGVDGTMQGRLAGTAVAGNALMKTGTLPEVRSVAGYVLSQSGRWHVVVMLVNARKAADAVPAIDALVRWVYDR